MSWLRKAKVADDAAAEVEEVAEAVADGETEAAPGAGTTGPFDEADAPAGGRRIDLGSLRLPVVPNLAVRMEVDRKSGRPVAVTLNHEGSTMQLQAFAAPRTLGVWDDVRAELAGQATANGGTAKEIEGRFGTELAAELPAKTADGKQGKRRVRFIGVDGPRWFLRGVIGGKAATDKAAAKLLEDVFAGAVVVRGSAAHPPRELLPLTLPGARPAATEASQGDPLALLRRGPEITEVR
ncbi:MAG: DUF3710 domain-containing protein [Bifidobacteriaceae bacterium]|jgi:hypothetical protein|nr:DUF3710 domain-containing protein [Bifidobacteriaceae bacterium]